MQTALFTQGLDVINTLSDTLDPYAFDEAVRTQGRIQFIGVDEAGRGPLAGPVYAAAVILPSGHPLRELRDSKTVPEAERERLAAEIQKHASAWAVAWTDEKTIDQINILNAALLAMQRAVEKLGSGLPVLVDGNKTIPGIPNPQRALVKGDSRSASVAAAAILAKVGRDRHMTEMDRKYPGYFFGKHKGYPTQEHIGKIRALGPCEIHRKTFKGVSA
jgi:ribonuclease HII